MREEHVLRHVKYEEGNFMSFIHDKIISRDL